MTRRNTESRGPRRMMSPEQATRAARLLRTARADARSIDGLPDDCRPGTVDDGYAVQEAFIDQEVLVDQVGGQVAGFKIGATSERAQAFLGIDGPFYGQVLQKNLFASPARLIAGDYSFRLIEPEFALRLGAPLPARAEAYGPEEVAAAVDAVAPAIEVVASALSDWNSRGIASMIADNGCDAALVLGPIWHAAGGLDLARHEVNLSVNGEAIGSGSGANCLGHPLNAMTWLANQRARQGKGLDRGTVVSTGLITPFALLESGDQALADFGALGKVTLSFS